MRQPAAPKKPRAATKHSRPDPPQQPSPSTIQAPIVPTMPAAFSCGAATCFQFDNAQSALSTLVITQRPRLLALGEAHAPQGYTGRTTVARFTDDLLPALAPQASYLLVELLLPPAEGCQKERSRAQAESDKITEGQSKANQNEYAILGKRARDLGVVPDILRATCDDLKHIASPEGGVFAMMETIAQVSRTSLTTMLDRADARRPLVLAYGGALHNDATPRTDRESWSYGPEMLEKTAGQYLEVDLMIPELVGDSESWRRFGWYDSYRQLPPEQKGHVLLMKWAQRSYVLFF